MQTRVFKLEITLGNEAMQTFHDVADCLERTAKKMRDLERMSEITTFDINGNAVGKTSVITRRI